MTTIKKSLITFALVVLAAFSAIGIIIGCQDNPEICLSQAQK